LLFASHQGFVFVYDAELQFMYASMYARTTVNVYPLTVLNARVTRICVVCETSFTVAIE